MHYAAVSYAHYEGMTVIIVTALLHTGLRSRLSTPESSSAYQRQSFWRSRVDRLTGKVQQLLPQPSIRRIQKHLYQTLQPSLTV
jgi:hypothetical protein